MRGGENLSSKENEMTPFPTGGAVGNQAGRSPKNKFLYRQKNVHVTKATRLSSLRIISFVETKVVGGVERSPGDLITAKRPQWEIKTPRVLEENEGELVQGCP